MSKYGVFSGPYFPAFELNTDVDLVWMRENRDQQKPRIWTLFTQGYCAPLGVNFFYPELPIFFNGIIWRKNKKKRKKLVQNTTKKNLD